MILKENYDSKTTLKDWWKTVRDNFRTISENAASKKELSDSVSKAITEYVSGDMAVLEEVRQALEENADVVEVLNSSTASINAHKADKTNPHGVTAAQVGLGNVLNVEQASKTELAALDAAKTEIVFGTYNITDLTAYYKAEERISEVFINLGFTPKAVEVCKYNGCRSQSYGNEKGETVVIYGGTAITGFPCRTTHYANLEGGGSSDTVSKMVNHIEIAPNGFYVRDFIIADTSTSGWKLSSRNAVTSGLHYFKAYKNINIINTGDEDAD